MGLTMEKILNRYSDCNKFSLTGRVLKYNITEEEFFNALAKIETKTKEEKRIIYEKNKNKFVNYPDFDTLYEEIKQECNNFDSEENRIFYLNKRYNEKINQYKKIGITDEKIEKMKENFFNCRFIADFVGKTTKYGKEHQSFFWNLYYDIAMNIDRKKDKEKYCVNNRISPIEQIPQGLKEHLLYYEISFYNAVTISGGLMINYYFKLNEETKNYLLQFRNDFDMQELEDLTFYKNDEIKFYSCTHEQFNSIEFDYKNMANDEIIDFVNDEYPNDDNNEIIEFTKKLTKMEIGTKFSFKELGVNSKMLMEQICDVCAKLNLRLMSSKNKEHSWSTVNENGEFQKVEELPAGLCKLEDLIEKKN